MTVMILSACYLIMSQEAGRLHLRCCRPQLHGREGRGVQAGHHRQWEGVRNHGIRHRAAQELPLETTYRPGVAAVPWGRWAPGSAPPPHPHTLVSACIAAPLALVQSSISRKESSPGRVNILPNSVASSEYHYLHHTLTHVILIHTLALTVGPVENLRHLAHTPTHTL